MQIQPIVVRDIGNGTYQLLISWRRLSAAGEMKMHDMLCRVVRWSKTKALYKMYHENKDRKNITAIDQARLILEMMKVGHKSETENAKELGINKSTLCNRLRVYGDPVLRNLMSRGQVFFGTRVVAPPKGQGRRAGSKLTDLEWESFGAKTLGQSSHEIRRAGTARDGESSNLVDIFDESRREWEWK